MIIRVLLIFLLLYDFCVGEVRENLNTFIHTVHNGMQSEDCSCTTININNNNKTCPEIQEFYPDFISDNRMYINFYEDMMTILNLKDQKDAVIPSVGEFKYVVKIIQCLKEEEGPLGVSGKDDDDPMIRHVCNNLGKPIDSKWTPIFCPNGTKPIQARYLTLINNIPFVFVFDMRNYKVDLCQIQADLCQPEEDCIFEQVSTWRLSLENFKCVCRKNCSDSQSLSQKVPLILQTFCIAVCLLLGLLIFKFKTTKVMKLANWFLLELFLLGAILLYLAALAYYINAEEWSCFLGPWLRGIGFSIMVLSSFQSRKAHRVYVRDKDMLKYLGVFIGIHIALLAGWTCINLDYISNSPWSEFKRLGLGMLTETQGKQRSLATAANTANLTMTDTSKRFIVCRILSWNIVAEIIEFVTLTCAIRYCCLIKSAPNEYNEMNCITFALFIEAFISGIFHIIRHFIWTKIPPDYSFIIDFLRTQLTVTVNVILIIAPKLWYIRCRNSGVNNNNLSTNFRGIPGDKGNKQELLSYSNDADLADINLSDMDPEVIRRELKRLYAQIEIYKLKAMRKDNPHISKRRGGRKQRRFSLQPFHKKHYPGSGAMNMSQIQSESPSVVQSGSGVQSQSPETNHISRQGGGCSQVKGTTTTAKTTAAAGAAAITTSKSLKKCPNSFLIHEEEISRVSEDSINSVDETTLNLLNVKLNS